MVKTTTRLAGVLEYDRALVVGEGRVLEDGPPKELLARPMGFFSALYRWRCWWRWRWWLWWFCLIVVRVGWAVIMTMIMITITVREDNNKKVLLLLRQEKRSSWKQMEIIGQPTESLFSSHPHVILWSWAAEVISLCPFSIQDLAFNSFVNKPLRSAHGYVIRCSYYYNKQDRIFGSLTQKEFGFTWCLRSQVSINGAR